MAPPKYSIAGYRNRLRTTSRPTLLVEGRTDKIAFHYLIDELEISEPEIWIDTADIIQDSTESGSGNRRLVEVICESAEQAKLSDKIVGFVDREFRKFDETQGMDLLGTHHVQGRLVWSRGHSIENYVFDIETLRDAFRSVGMTTDFTMAAAKMQGIFDSALRLACAVGLTANELQRLRLVTDSISWNELAIHGENLLLETDKWKQRLMARSRCSEEMADDLISAYQRWISRMQTMEVTVARWFCHGHVGFSILWAAFARAVFEVSGKDKDADRVFGANADIRYESSVHAWVKRVNSSNAIAPLIVLDLLGLPIGCLEPKAKHRP